MRYAARIDGNKKEIVNHFRLCGASVYDLKMPVDLLVGFAGKTALVEVKDPQSAYGRRGANPNQRSFMESWNGGTVALIDSIEAADRLLKVME